jgi:hypothetical protein
MFVVDKVVEEDRRMLLANELESITLPDGTTQALGPAARDAFAIFEDLCLLGNGERPQFLQLEYLHKTFALEREGTHELPHQLSHKVCLLLLPIRDLYASSCLQITLMFTAFQALILITTPPSAASQNTLRLLHFPACAPRYLYCLPLAQAILPRARDGDGGHSHLHSTHRTHYWRD